MVNVLIFTGVLNHADPLSAVAPASVICSRFLVTVAEPLSDRSAVELNPLAKLIVVPAAWIV